MAGVALLDIDLHALGNIVLATIFPIGGLFLVLFSLWNAPGFQSIAPVSKSHVCVVGIVLICFDDMYHTVFQSDAKMSGFQSDASDCVPK